SSPSPGSEERPEVFDENIGYLHGREVSTLAWLADRSGMVRTLHPTSWSGKGLVRVTADAKWYVKRGWRQPRARYRIHHLVVHTHRRVDGSGKPVDRDVVEQPVRIELSISLGSAPAVELLKDPGSQTSRRIGEPVGNGLRLGGVDPLVARFGRNEGGQLVC